MKNMSLLWTGIDQETFRKIKPDIEKSNRKNLMVFSGLATIILSVLFICSLVWSKLIVNRRIYLVMALLMLSLFYVSMVVVEKRREMIWPCIYLFTGSLFWFGIRLGTFNAPDSLATNFIVLLFAVPLLFIGKPIYMNAMILGAIGVFFYGFKGVIS